MKINQLWRFLPFLCIIGSSCTHKIQHSDFLSANIDPSVKPSEDFFMYANGGWIKKNPIPASESSWGIGELVQEELYKRMKTINEDAATGGADSGSIAQKIGDFWKSAMDTTSLNKNGLSPLLNLNASIESVKTSFDLVDIASQLHVNGVDVLFNDYVGQDDKNSSVMVYQVNQGGLGMPNRDYYFNEDVKTKTVRTAYKNYIYQTFLQLGRSKDSAVMASDSVFDLERQLAGASKKLSELRDPYANYNKISLDSLSHITPEFNWSVYLQRSGLPPIDSLIVGQIGFLREMDTLLTSVSLSTWKDYLQFHLVSAFAFYLDQKSADNAYAYIKTLTGTSVLRVRWKRVLDAEQGVMGEALGQLFVKHFFNAAAKKRYIDLVEAIRSAYKDRIEKLTWMSDSTKQKALFKLSRITKKVGYPDHWKDFSTMDIGKYSYATNMLHANQWWHYYQITKLGRPVDRSEWDMSPQTYNAYYNPANNEIVLPAGMFTVPGMRDEDLDDAFVYGYAAASTIGHEITHGFDDQGRQYDAEGNLRNWWQPRDESLFKERATMIIRQFNEFVPVDTLHINGEATQGENIADLGGLLLGLDAFKKTEAYKEGKLIHGMTPLQRYFLGYAYSWMYEERKEKIASQVMTDVHAPAKERVNGPVVNIPEFYEAFDVKPGDKMYREDSLRVKIW